MSTKEYYGNSTVAKDGKIYRSRFEAEFVNKFLLPSGLEYHYEVSYPKGKFTCDFYIPKFDIWIECVYHKIEYRPAYTQKKSIVFNVPYHQKETIKKYGCKWDPSTKRWYLLYKGQDITVLEKFMSKEDLEPVLVSNQKAMHDEYDSNLEEKLSLLERDVLIVNYTDLKDYEDISHLIRGKGHKMLLWKIIEFTFLIEKEKCICSSIG